MDDNFKVYFVIITIILILVGLYGWIYGGENINYKIKQNKNANKSEKQTIKEINVTAIGVTRDDTFGTITFHIYLIPKNKFFDNVSFLTSFDKTTFGNTLQDYLKKVKICINKHLTNHSLDDYIIYIKGDSNFPDIDGGSGSAIIALGIYYLLKNKTLDPKIIATGTIDENCTIGHIEGIKTKLIGVESLGFKKFYVPYNDYNFLNNNNTKVKIIPVKNLKDIINGEING